MRLLVLLLASPLLPAQISGPALGFATHQGELRRVEGLSGSSRLSAVLARCGRLEAGVRWALCGDAEKLDLIDLRDLSARALPGAPASFERAVWSADGSAVALDSMVYSLPDGAQRFEAGGEVAAVSDAGFALLRDHSGALRHKGEAVVGGGGDATAAAFDGEALLIATPGRLRRIEAGRAPQEFPLSSDAQFLASDAAAFYTASARAVTRIDRASGESATFDLPAADASITRLDRLADGSLLVAKPGANEPGWLFRGGRFAFIPGIEAAR